MSSSTPGPLTTTLHPGSCKRGSLPLCGTRRLNQLLIQILDEFLELQNATSLSLAAIFKLIDILAKNFIRAFELVASPTALNPHRSVKIMTHAGCRSFCHFLKRRGR
jgi:hypothetical protein